MLALIPHYYLQRTDIQTHKSQYQNYASKAKAVNMFSPKFEHVQNFPTLKNILRITSQHFKVYCVKSLYVLTIFAHNLPIFQIYVKTVPVIYYKRPLHS